MKSKKYISILFLLLCISYSCTTTFYQIYKVVPSESAIQKENFVVFEDDHCIVSYNLWADGGNMGFRFYNKTDSNIYLNLEESFFILNGIAYNYYYNRVFSQSTNSAVATSKSGNSSESVQVINYLGMLQTQNESVRTNFELMTSNGLSISYKEEKIICIPTKASKIISEHRINTNRYRDCDLFQYPKKKNVKSKDFSQSESPLIFTNRISYFLAESDTLFNFENEFYVSEITNYPEWEIVESNYDVFCNEKSISSTETIKNVSPEKFYIKYSIGKDKRDH